VTALAAAGEALAGVDELWIVCDEANERSAAVAKRCGFSVRRIEERVPECPGESGRLLIFVRSAADVP
jgi:RimJ/RimL family protein N-acetyltransferase